MALAFGSLADRFTTAQLTSPFDSTRRTSFALIPNQLGAPAIPVSVQGDPLMTIPNTQGFIGGALPGAGVTRIDFGGALGAVGMAACSNVPQSLQAACLALNAALTTGSNFPGTLPGETLVANPCPEGFTLNNGQCETAGLGGFGERLAPGGKSGTLADVAGGSTIGAWGLAARFPAQVGTITRDDGTVGAILRCPKGHRLGSDDLCYVKGTKGVVWKHKKAATALLTAKDGKILARAASLEEKVKKVAGKYICSWPKTRPKKC